MPSHWLSIHAKGSRLAFTLHDAVGHCLKIRGHVDQTFSPPATTDSLTSAIFDPAQSVFPPLYFQLPRTPTREFNEETSISIPESVCFTEISERLWEMSSPKSIGAEVEKFYGDTGFCREHQS